MVEDEIEAEVEAEVEDLGAAAVFVRLVRCLLVDDFALALALVLAGLTLGVCGGESGGSEPAVAVVESLLNEECVDVWLVMEVVDAMEDIVEVLQSPDGFWTLLDVVVEAEAEMELSMSAIA